MKLPSRRDVSPGARRSLAVSATAVLTPTRYLSYVVVVRWLRGYPGAVDVRPSVDLALYVLVLALIGVVAVLGWDWRLRVAPLTAAGVLLVWPWFPGVLTVGDTVSVLFPFVVVLVATAAEGIVRFRERVERLFLGSAGRTVLAAGAAHFLLGFALQVYARGLPLLHSAGPRVFLEGALHVASGVALVATGALPVVLWQRRRLVAPALTTIGWFSWGLYETWRRREGLPLGRFTGANWGSLAPHPDYMLNWTGLVIALLVVAGCELALRRAGRRLRAAGVASAG